MGFQTHYMYSQTVWGPWAPQQVPPHLCGQKRWKYYEEIPYRFICWWCFVWNFLLWTMWGFPRSAVVKNLPTNAGDTRDLSLIPGSERSPGVGNSNPFQCSCLGNPMDRGAWRATVHEVAKSRTRLQQLSTHTRIPLKCGLFPFGVVMNNPATNILQCSILDAHGQASF